MTDEQEFIKQLQASNQTLKDQNNILEGSLKGALKENTVLRIDIQVLKSQLKNLEKESVAPASDELDILKKQLDFKIKECESLNKELDEDKLMLQEMEKQLQSKGTGDKRIKELENQVKSLTKIVDAAQKK